MSDKATHTYYPVGILMNEEVQAHLANSWWARYCLGRIHVWGARLLNSVSSNCHPVGLTRDTKMPVNQ